MNSKTISVSVIIPIYNEEKSIRLLYNKIIQTLKSIDNNFEIIFIDDGSNDNSYEEIRKIVSNDIRTKCLRFRKNFGKSATLAVGFNNAKGEIIITMDADLQDDPKQIPKFVSKINDGWDVVSGWKKLRKDPFEKRVLSKIFNFTVSKISGISLHDFNCGFKAYRRDVVEKVKIYGELHRFIPMLAYKAGFKVCEVSIEHHCRRFGKSKFGKRRYLSGFFDLFTTIFISGYIRKPLHFLGRISLSSFTLGILLFFYVFIMKFFFGQKGDRPALLISIFLLSFSIQIFLFGLLADLLTYSHQKYYFDETDFIKEKLNFSNHNSE